MENKKNSKIEQVSIRLIKEKEVLSSQPVKNPDEAVVLIASLLGDMDREVSGIINFKSDGSPINFSICSMGTLNQSLVNPRDFLKTSILSNAQAIMLFHNHPSGSLQPSKEDRAITKRFSSCCELMGFQFLDHIIMVPEKNEYYSLRNEKNIRYCTEKSEYEIRSIAVPIENEKKRKTGKIR